MTKHGLYLLWFALSFVQLLLCHVSAAQPLLSGYNVPNPIGPTRPGPVVPVTERWLEPKKHIPAQTETRMPLDTYRITSRFGWRTHPVTGRPDFHNGVDLAARAQVVHAIMEGTVTATGYQPQLGNYVRIDHGSVHSIYGHLSGSVVRRGQSVAAGHPLGVTGRTGRATGEHLHFAIQRNGTYINPLKFLRTLIENNVNK